MKHVLMTGFPGFLATRLLHALMQKYESARFVLLVHPSQFELANERIKGLDKVEVKLGDITEESLGFSEEDSDLLREKLTHVFHLAAIYDLAVPQLIAEKVNVEGTKNINQFVQSLQHLERYVYFSTAYVSGNRTGLIRETELQMGQQFKNHYEETKYKAEVLVQELKDVPYTVIRPGITVGNSETGETSKFDGPYFIMRILDRIRFMPIPHLGKGDVLFNVVPYDYLINATVYLSEAEEAERKTFHLTDPNPHQARDLYRMICEELLGKKPTWTISPTLVELGLSLSFMRKFFGVEKEAVEYFRCPTQYDASEAKKVLEKGGLTCPDFKDYVRNIVTYYKQHRLDQDKKIHIT
ncbi:NAD-dependent epimerase/dehydratase family protein [Bacillus sp. HNG]|uniref:SDR family oxidoreductase n=1 Tax=Bacillus sp. HNG TaxID=2293325 RepID=UPI000E2F02C2|nr:SDR family oxidoreductase [Bacillus sp. HNG]RFB16885.1 NAD-dependent epimerase/dehydratase family protein [Bacillus sp. HNG]